MGPIKHSSFEAIQNTTKRRSKKSIKLFKGVTTHLFPNQLFRQNHLLCNCLVNLVFLEMCNFSKIFLIGNKCSVSVFLNNLPLQAEFLFDLLELNRFWRFKNLVHIY